MKQYKTSTCVCAKRRTRSVFRTKVKLVLFPALFPDWWTYLNLSQNNLSLIGQFRPQRSTLAISLRGDAVTYTYSCINSVISVPTSSG
jgi:hypothetical protein